MIDGSQVAVAAIVLSTLVIMVVIGIWNICGPILGRRSGLEQRWKDEWEVIHMIRKAEREKCARELESVIADWPRNPSLKHNPYQDGQFLADLLRKNG